MKVTEVTAGLAESNGSLLPGLWRDSLHVTCGLTACTPGSAPGPTLGNEYGKTLPYLLPTSVRKGSKRWTQLGWVWVSIRSRILRPHVQAPSHLQLLCMLPMSVRSAGTRKTCRSEHVAALRRSTAVVYHSDRQAWHYYFVCSRGAKYSDQLVFIFVCLSVSLLVWKSACSHFAMFPLCAAFDRGSVFLWRH